MPRTRLGKARHRKKKRILKAAKGYRGSRSKLWRSAKQAVARAQATARGDRRRKKRDWRGLWITRLSAACRSRGIRYSVLINGLKLAGIALNRKMLSEIAVTDPAAFDGIARAALGALELPIPDALAAPPAPEEPKAPKPKAKAKKSRPRRKAPAKKKAEADEPDEVDEPVEEPAEEPADTQQQDNE
jgi:large subunit ribosomal protein L20